MKPYLALPFALSLIACGTGVQYAPITKPAAGVAPKSPAASERFVDYENSEVRTIIEQDDKTIEIEAQCVFENDLYRTQFTTPTYWQQPVIKKTPSPLNVNCSAPNYSYQANYLPERKITTAGAGTSSLLVNIAVAAATTAYSASKQEFIYNSSSETTTTPKIPGNPQTSRTTNEASNFYLTMQPNGAN